MAFQASAVRQSRCVTSHMCRGQRHRSGDGGGDAGGGTCRARFHHVRRGVRAHGHLRRFRAGLLLAIAHGRGRVAARGRARGACPERECGCTRPRSGRLPRTTPAAVRRRQAVSEGWQDYVPLLVASVFSHVTGPWLFGTACTACSSPVLVPAVWRGVVRGFAGKVLQCACACCVGAAPTLRDARALCDAAERARTHATCVPRCTYMSARVCSSTPTNTKHISETCSFPSRSLLYCLSQLT